LRWKNHWARKNVWPGQPIMASEDFSLFALEDPKPPITMFWLGAPDPPSGKKRRKRERACWAALERVCAAAGAGDPDWCEGYGPGQRLNCAQVMQQKRQKKERT